MYIFMCIFHYLFHRHRMSAAAFAKNQSLKYFIFQIFICIFSNQAVLFLIGVLFIDWFLATPCSMQDPSSLTRDWIQAPCTGTHGLPVCGCAQSCPTLCQPMNYSLPGSSVHEILQARILEWVAISYSGDLPDPGIEPATLTPPVLAGRLFIIGTTWEAYRAYSASPWPSVPPGGQGTPSLLGSQAPAHFYADSLLEPFNPWFLQMNLCLPNTTQNFFPGWDSVRYQAKSDHTFIFHLSCTFIPQMVCFAWHDTISDRVSNFAASI